MNYIHRFFQPPSASFFLLGARGTGKTLWCEQNYPKSFYINLLQTDMFRTLSAYPEKLMQMVDERKDRSVVIIDEIQKIPELLNIVHLLIEKKRAIRFVLTGSSARKLRRGGVNLLGGRAMLCTLHPFMAAELGNAFNIKQALKTGLVPLVWNSDDRLQAIKSYLTLYIREEVQMEALTRNIGGFARFLEAMSFSHGQVINLNNISRECEVPRKTAETYLDILIDLNLGITLPVFTKKAKRGLIHHSKFYFFDAGVFQAARLTGKEEITGEGSTLEGIVEQHLRAWNAYRGNRNQLYFWRTTRGNEVDFILYGEDGLWAIEVTSSRNVHPADIRGLKSFKEDYPEANLLLLYCGSIRLKKDGVHCLPCNEFLLKLHPENEVLFY